MYFSISSGGANQSAWNAVVTAGNLDYVSGLMREVAELSTVSRIDNSNDQSMSAESG